MKNLYELYKKHSLDNTHKEYERWIETLQKKIAEGTKYEYQITTIKYAKEDKNSKAFGFAEYYPAFCHSNKLVGLDPQEFQRICQEKIICLVHSYPDKNDDKARFTTWFCPIDYVNDQTWGIISQYSEVVWEELKQSAQKAEEFEESYKQQLASKEALDGIKYKLKKQVDDPNYGGTIIRVYEFNTQITKATFIAFCDSMGLKIEAKPCCNCICPETVEFSTFDAVTWTYEYHGNYGILAD